MTWFKLDDRFHSHPKVIAAGNAAVGLWVRLGAWSSDHGTNGAIPRAVGLSFGGKRELTALTTAGLLHPADDGWVIHDFLDYNPSAEHVADVRSKRADAGARGGKQKASKLLANDVAESCPVPEPVPTVLQTTDDSESLPPDPGPSSSSDDAQDGTLETIAWHAARILYRRSAHTPGGAPIQYPRRWIETVATVMLTERAIELAQAAGHPEWTLDTQAEWVLTDPELAPDTTRPEHSPDPDCPRCAGDGWYTVDHESNTLERCSCTEPPPPLRLVES